MRVIIKPDYDWWPEINQTIYCQCGEIFRGRVKLKSEGKELVRYIDRECPGCGKNLKTRRVSSDPELWSIG